MTCNSPTLIALASNIRCISCNLHVPSSIAFYYLFAFRSCSTCFFACSRERILSIAFSCSRSFSASSARCRSSRIRSSFSVFWAYCLCCACSKFAPRLLILLSFCLIVEFRSATIYFKSIIWEPSSVSSELSCKLYPLLLFICSSA